MRLTLVVTTLTVAVVPGSSIRAQRYGVAGIDNDSSVVSFLRQLQAAVRGKHPYAVASLVRYPLAVNDSSRTTTVRDSRQFILHYSEILTAPVRHAILAQLPESLFANWQGVMLGNGQVWFNLICGPNPPHTCTRLAVTTVNRDAPPVR